MHELEILKQALRPVCPNAEIDTGNSQIVLRSGLIGLGLRLINVGRHGILAPLQFNLWVAKGKQTYRQWLQQRLQGWRFGDAGIVDFNPPKEKNPEKGNAAIFLPGCSWKNMSADDVSRVVETYKVLDSKLQEIQAYTFNLESLLSEVSVTRHEDVGVSSGGLTRAADGDHRLFDVIPKEHIGNFNPSVKAQIIHVPDLLALNLRIPNYQRPYKWSESSVQTFLDDIRDLVENCPTDRAYRIGSVILHDAGKGMYNVVDGQQRTLTLILLSIALGLGSRFANDAAFFAGLSQSKESAINLRRNFRVIAGYIADLKSVECGEPAEDTESDGGSDVLERFRDAVERQLEIVVITVKREAEAFQLFDCQNTRGRKLDPQDLLKAFHLREIEDIDSQKNAAESWDRVESRCDEQDRDPSAVSHRDLFNLYLYRILKWSKGEKPGEFTEKDIDLFKGVPRMERKNLGYAQRAAKAMPCYQIGDDFIPGGDFFEMVKHYRGLYAIVLRRLGESDSIRHVVEELDDGSKAFSYAKQLFLAAVLAYMDRFGRYDESAARRLCAWAFMLRVDLRKVGDKSIIKYALGGEDSGSRYTNHISMFVRIRQARRHTEITNMVIDFPAEDKVDPKRKGLWAKLKNLIGA